MIGKQTLDFDSGNAVKAEFQTIYVAPDPRAYFRVLYGLNYVIPEVAKGVFRGLIEALGRRRGKRLKVLDIGCSYGINTALIRTSLDMDRLAHRYADMSLERIAPAEQRKLDRMYFESWPSDCDATFIGLDISKPAVDYARAVGLLDGGIVADLENADLSAADRAVLADVDLIISTGCVGYVTERTFSKVLDCITGPKPWVASFVLRMFPFDAVAACLADHGLATQKLEGVTFAQRRFFSKDEQQGVIEELERLGLSATDKEAAGVYHAELFLSRSQRDARALPLEAVVSVSNGIDGQLTGWRRWH